MGPTGQKMGPYRVMMGHMGHRMGPSGLVSSPIGS